MPNASLRRTALGFAWCTVGVAGAVLTAEALVPSVVMKSASASPLSTYRSAGQPASQATEQDAVSATMPGVYDDLVPQTAAASPFSPPIETLRSRGVIHAE